MPLQKLQLRPGINRESTTLSNEGGYYACDKVRFRSGYPEQIGGWQRLTNNTYVGTCRSLFNWASLTGENYLGVGTHLKYFIERGGVYNDITPIVATYTLTNIFSTAFSTLSAGLVVGATTINLTSAASFPLFGAIKIGTEEMFYGAKVGNTLINVVRGYNNTTEATHLTGANVGCATISVTDVANNFDNDGFIIISGASAVGGIPATAINQEWQVNKVATGLFLITVSAFSTSVATGGGTCTIQKLVPAGLDTYAIGLGWGAGVWGRGGWGSSATVGIGQQLRLWTQDNYGEDLVFAPRGGALYYWDATTSVSARGVPLDTLSTSNGFAGAFVPNKTNQVISSGVSRFIIALGANPYDPTDSETDFDPLLVRWSDQENVFNWVPTPLNQSGEQRLSNGSYIMCGRATRQEILIWTDSALFSMQYLGPPNVFGFTMIMDNLSVIGPNTTITVNNVTYWMGVDKFYIYNGRVQTLPCTLRQYVFGNINQAQAYQFFAGSNEGYNEVWWFYCSANSIVIDRYVVYNHLEDVWYYGNMNRTAWLDSPIRAYPMAAIPNRIVYHESVVDDESGEAPIPINSYITTADFDIGDGHNMGFVWRMLPDITFDGSTSATDAPPQVTMTVEARYNSGVNYGPSDDPTVTRTATYPVEQYTGQIYTRIRGRQMAIRIEANRLGCKWQLGTPRYDVRPDGRR